MSEIDRAKWQPKPIAEPGYLPADMRDSATTIEPRPGIRSEMLVEPDANTTIVYERDEEGRVTEFSITRNDRADQFAPSITDSELRNTTVRHFSYVRDNEGRVVSVTATLDAAIHDFKPLNQLGMRNTDFEDMGNGMSGRETWLRENERTILLNEVKNIPVGSTQYEYANPDHPNLPSTITVLGEGYQKIAELQYDADGRIVQKTETVSFNDSEGKDPQVTQYNFEYNADGQLVRQVAPMADDPRVESQLVYLYDQQGRLTERKYGLRSVSEQGEISEQPLYTEVTFTYEGNTMTQVSGNGSQEVIRTFDDTGEIIEEIRRTYTVNKEGEREPRSYQKITRTVETV